MTTFKKIPILLAIIVSFFIIASACNTSKMVFKNGDHWIPKDFEPSKTILLVEYFYGSKKKEDKVEEYMSEKYPYKFEFVSLSVIKKREGKYADTKLYKYALVTSSSSSSISKSEGASTSGGMMVTGTDFNFYDRSNDKLYPPTKRGSSNAMTTFKPVINTIVKKFE